MKEKKVETIVDEYRGGDVTRRLHMFLDYPELRQAFMDIDASEGIMQKPVRDAASPGPCQRVMRRMTFAFNHFMGLL